MLIVTAPEGANGAASGRMTRVRPGPVQEVYGTSNLEIGRGVRGADPARAG